MQPNTIISPNGATVVLPSRELLMRMLKPKATTRNKDMKPLAAACARELEAA
ncbi:hypothetical protein [Acetobacter indonesiensis]|nr:hypothetical protein [Acetobacter indonesiensis]